MAEAYYYTASGSAPTILDMLNPDCWRILLSYVPAQDIVRSERVSRVWRQRVLEYLGGINFSVQYIYPSVMKITDCDRHPNSRLLTLNKEEPPEQHGALLTSLVARFGPKIVAIASDRINETDLANIIWHCSNLERILIPDEYISQLLDDVPIEELVLDNACYISGMFLTDEKMAKLKYLSITSCYNLMTEFFPETTDLESLTKLELVLNSAQVYRDVHLLLNNTPNLEHLSLVTFDKKTNVGSDFVQALRQLSRLKHFYARFINNSNDGWLKEVASGCKELQTVDVGNCTGVTPSSLLSLCRARGPALTELGVAWNNLVTDDDLADCLALCPNLKTLDVQGCVQVTPRLVEIVRQTPRYWPLCLRLRRTKVPTEIMAECLWLILDFGY